VKPKRLETAPELYSTCRSNRTERTPHINITSKFSFSQNTRCIPVTTTNQLLVLKQILVAYFKNYTKPINKFCMEHVQFPHVTARRARSNRRGLKDPKEYLSITAPLTPGSHRGSHIPVRSRSNILHRAGLTAFAAVLFRSPFYWNVTLPHWVIGSQRFEST
jgi:hypothetical protein